VSKEVLEFHDNNSICEAYGCFERATTKIQVNVGHLGSISLDLCTNCEKKFDIKESVLMQVKQLFSKTEAIAGGVSK
jgi:hypothetical protein